MLNAPAQLNAVPDIFPRLIDRAVKRQLSIADLFNGAAALQSVQKTLAVELYKTWIAANGDDKLLYAVYFNYGIALNDARDPMGAINAFRESIRLKPDFSPPYINLGRSLEDIGQAGSAVSEWMTLIGKMSAVNGEALAHKLTAMHQAARVLESLNSDAAAEELLRQMLDLDPHQDEAAQHLTSLRQRQAKWPILNSWERVKRSDLVAGMSTLSLANFTDDPMFQLAKAYRYAKQAIGMPKATPRSGATRSEPLRLRIGYVSSDLRDHAVGFAMTDVIEQHDRKNFEIFAYYCGINRPDVTQERIKSSVDHWVDINGMDDDQAAARIASDRVDILVDLNGYTKDARTKVFARKPAPIIVNWFGYPNTMGTPYHNYLIADDFIVPRENELYYSEKIVRLPCYQPNDRKRPVAAHKPTRAEAGLPDEAFVYCCLNGMQKITARTYQRWMTILHRTPNSVLWVLTGTDEANARLRQVAVDGGLAAERIVFAEKKANPEHLARYPLADLFLDSFPYGAHTTASDSMWMGVPILTFPGRSFAARVCADLVRAAGIGEMVCNSADDYVERAVAFGSDPDSLTPIKTKLVASRDTCLLFDTPKLVVHLEDAYRQMWSDLIRGAVPRPDLRNLDMYHDIGLELDLEGIELLSDEAYRALYRDKLSAWNASYTVPADTRFWRDTEPEGEALATPVTLRASA